jgi:next-to-BRCA1 protein 1
MTQRWVIYVAASALVSLLLACGNSRSSGPSVSDRATGLAQTAEALLTGTAAASVTPETPTPEPSATPAPTATATQAPVTVTPAPTIPPTPCAPDDSDFVSDVNVPDGTHVKPGAAFTKTWRLRNSGQCAWTTAYTLRNVGGEIMGGTTINVPNGVPPGATVDLSVAFVAPSSPGKHISRWQMFTPDGAAFGTKPFVQIMVP